MSKKMTREQEKAMFAKQNEGRRYKRDYDAPVELDEEATFEFWQSQDKEELLNIVAGDPTDYEDEEEYEETLEMYDEYTQEELAEECADMYKVYRTASGDIIYE